METENLTAKVVEKVELAAEVGTKVANIVGNAFESAVADVDQSASAEDNTWLNYLASFGIHIAMVIIVLLLKWQYDRNRYRYPKEPQEWRNIKDAVSFHRKKRENLLVLANDYPEFCTVVTYSGRLVLLNNPKTINEIFVARADLVSDKVDGYIENQLRYKDGKHIRSGIVFRHRDHNALIIHRALVNHWDKDLLGENFNSIVQEQLRQIRLSENFDVHRTMFYFAVRLLTSLACSTATSEMDEKTFELFQQNLYKISKVIHEDTVEKTAKAILTQLTGLSETLDINTSILDYIKTWIQRRHSDENPSADATTEQPKDFLGSVLNILDESSPRLDQDDLAACVLDVIMHGSEMIKGALTWFLLYAVKYPEETDRCRREAQIENYTKFDMNTAGSLSITQAFVKEVLRMSPVVPVVIHSTSADFRWQKFHIQKRTSFGANILALHHSAAWKNASQFNIDRWLGGEAALIPTTSYLPFGFGPRSCVAEKYLFDLLTGILAVLLYHNNFESTGSLPELTDGSFGLANIPPEYTLKATSSGDRL